jgi:ketosteroid isomerase-like protein
VVAGTTAEHVVLELFEALDAGRLDELLHAIHPGAELRPLSADGETLLGREGAAQWLDSLQSRDALLRHTVERTIPLPGDVVVAVGRQQRFEPDDGLVDRPVVWLLHFRDGRLWRGCVCASVEDAIARAGDGASSGPPSA